MILFKTTQQRQDEEQARLKSRVDRRIKRFVLCAMLGDGRLAVCQFVWTDYMVYLVRGEYYRIGYVVNYLEP